MAEQIEGERTGVDASCLKLVDERSRTCVRRYHIDFEEGQIVFVGHKIEAGVALAVELVVHLARDRFNLLEEGGVGLRRCVKSHTTRIMLGLVVVVGGVPGNDDGGGQHRGVAIRVSGQRDV